jgi:hypothetical protein
VRQPREQVGDHVPELRRHPDPGERQRVAVCLRNVNITRGELRVARHKAAQGWDKDALRAGLLVALEGYAAAITEIGAPVPRTLRNEIDLYRRLRNRS